MQRRMEQAKHNCNGLSDFLTSLYSYKYFLGTMLLLLSHVVYVFEVAACSLCVLE